MPMKYVKKEHRMLPTVLDSLACITVLMLALRLINSFENIVAGAEYDYSANSAIACALFLMLALSSGLQAFNARKGNRLVLIRHLISVAVFAFSGIFLLIRDADSLSTAVACYMYCLTLILGRLLSIYQNRRLRSIAANVIAVLLLLLFFQTEVRPLIAVVLIIILSMVHVAAVSFSQINIKVLRRIVRKTYATEIIFGMLLLIVAFSLLLPSMEPGIKSFGDGLWYCFAIVTTIGFGDITAVSIIGRFISVILGIYGILVVSLVTSIIVNFYNEVKNEEEDTDPDAPADTKDEGGGTES